MKNRTNTGLRLVLSLTALGALIFSLRFAFNSPVAAEQDDANRIAARAPTATTQPVRTIDDMFADVARLVPSFGGFFVGDDGRLNVYLLDTSHLPAAMQAIVAVFGRDQFPIENPVALQGRYNFTQLKAWHDGHRRQTMAMPGVSYADIDEMSNRLEIGVASFNAWMEVQQALNRLGIPAEAFNISEIAAMKTQQTLQSKWRPIAGGIQIRRGNGACTLGFLAVVQQKAGFFTNSHCTNTFGGANLEAFTQADTMLANRIGFELFDPALFTGGACPSGRQCRYSDAAFIWRDGSAAQPNPLVEGDFGYLLIADQPDSGTAVKHKITSRGNVSVAGDWVDKVGRTTGRTHGKITNTCSDTNQINANGSDTGRTMLCQNFVNATSMGGDSGSPVYSLETWPGGFTGVRLRGILWGGNGQQFVFSSLSQIDGDMQGNGGSMKVFSGDNPSSVPIARIRKPANNSTVGLGGINGVDFEADAVDYEDKNLTLTWTSDVDGLIGFGKKMSFVFTTPGQRNIKVVAKDDEGFQAEDSIKITVGDNTPPVVKIDVPSVNQQLYRGAPYTFQGSSYDPDEAGGVLPCNKMSWSYHVTNGISIQTPLGAGCGVPAKFNSNGNYTVKLIGTDSFGATDVKTVNVKVVDPPATGKPIVTLISPLDQSLLYGDVAFTLKGSAIDPDGKNPLTYEWSVNDNGNYKIIGTGTANNGQQFSKSWTPNLTIPHSCKTYQVTLILKVTDADGQSSFVQRTIFINYGPC
ncbi:MAG: hypothetical protein ACKVZH_24980 [Blastocatellia bacterium]